ncbi:hypothetical protein EW093_02350 [Thiospirochaeta perfilievii]|uniref:Uncharacterized protein n=1 Tax=Thiospirochaeta perfilievii TaxID=252967 RepID=A0A5C1Q9W2_9SPIO|nr:hypothetical protein [Thiospirochaeta perfilievii]QEN03586.1 hypothetical protein EW093_02350 [Thiospirochaeta perfilievii]
MIKRILLIFTLIITSSILLYSDEYTDEQLDLSIEEFSKKNYNEALRIIDEVLIVEPENEIALMYKKTIEDVIQIDQTKAEQESIKKSLESEDLLTDKKEVIILDSKQDSIRKSQNIITNSIYVGKDSSDDLVVENRTTILFGIPVLEFKLKSKSFDYNLINIDLGQLPIEDLVDLGNYHSDLSLGYRYKPFSNIIDNGGYFDLKLGVSNFSYDSEDIIPYIGFDTETYFLAVKNNNFIFNNLWFGGSAYIYLFDGEFNNNYFIESKLGINIGFGKLGLFYNLTHIESISNNEFDSDIFGIILGLSF